MPPDLPKGYCGPFSGHNHLVLYYQRPLISTVIETSGIELQFFSHQNIKDEQSLWHTYLDCWST